MVLKTGAWPAASYGHTAQGFSPAQINRTREVFAAASAVPGVDICARTALAITFGEGEDPAIKAAIDQVEFWIDFWLNNVHLQKRIRRYWGVTWLKFKQDNDRWKQVKGPVAAIISVLLDLDWIPMRHDMWKDPVGVFFCMRGVVYRDPATQRLIAHYEELKHAIRRDALKYTWDSRPKVGHNKGPEGAYAVSIVSDLAENLRKRDQHELAGALLMAACGGLPDRSKLYSKGVVESPMCLQCEARLAHPSLLAVAGRRWVQCRVLSQHIPSGWAPQPGQRDDVEPSSYPLRLVPYP